MPKVVLFEWTAGGHRAVYVRRLVEALKASAEVLLVLPQTTLDEIGDLGVETLSIGEERPLIAGRLTRRSVLVEEAARFRDAASRGDHAVHLYADHVLPRLIAERTFPSLITLLLYYPRAHYPTVYGTSLSASDWPAAIGKEWALRVWRRRSDAHAVFTLDEEAVRRWGRHRGAAARWLPEPPVQPLAPEDHALQREGCALYGALAPRKGLDLLAAALTVEPTTLRLVLAGSPAPSYLAELEYLAAEMATSEVAVDLRPYWHSELDGLRLLASASCAALPYPQHAGMSRVLLEACSVGTPVVTHRSGLLGYLVRKHGLGLSVDCTDRRALRTALLALTDPVRSAEYAEALGVFSARYVPAHFRDRLLSGLGLAPRASRGADELFKGTPGY